MMTEQKQKYPVNFIFLYTSSFMAYAILAAFMSIFYHVKGYSDAQIGILSSVGPFIALVMQPLWGMASDRARYKNDIVIFLTITSLFVVLLYNVASSFAMLVAVTILFTMVQSAILPITDTITLESLEHMNRSFGPIRMGGTIGYAVMAAVTGLFADKNLNMIFLLYSVLVAFSLIFTFRLPKVKGHRRGSKEKVSVLSIFKNKNLVMIFALSLVVNIMVCFYGTFFPIYFKDLGASNTMLGIAIFIAAMSEIPFLIFADRILLKIGINRALAGSAMISVIRWTLFFFITNPYLNLVIQLLHGCIYIVFAYSIVTYLSREVPKALKATAQTINAIIGGATARIISGLLGGYLSDKFGIKFVFLMNGIVTFVAALIFIAAFRFHQRSSANQDIDVEVEAEVV